MHCRGPLAVWMALAVGACASPTEPWVQERPTVNVAAGSLCGDDAQCASGVCAAGLCCDRACDGPCETCDLVASPGTCLPSPSVAAGACADEAVCGVDGRCAAPLLWGRVVGDVGSQSVAATTALGDRLIIAGRYDGALTGVGEALEGHGAFVAALDAEGVVLWRRVLPGPLYPTSLAASSAGLVLGGEATGAVTLGDQVLLPEDSDGVVVLLDPSGEPQWAQLLGGPAQQRVQAVALTGEGEVLAAGSHTGALPGTATPDGPDAFVARLGADGLRWLRSFGSVGADAARSVVLGGDGAVMVGGVINGAVTIDEVELAYAEGDDAFVAAFEPDGGLRWARGYGGIGADGVGAMALDPAGDLVVVGSFTKGIDFAPAAPGGVAEAMISLGCEDVFVVKLSPEGQARWSLRYGDDEPQLADAVAVDHEGGIHVSGMVYGGIELGWGVAAAAGDGDVHLVALDADGAPRWVRLFGDEARQRPHGMAVVDERVLALVGYVEGELSNGPLDLASGGAGDGFVMALGL